MFPPTRLPPEELPVSDDGSLRIRDTPVLLLNLSPKGPPGSGPSDPPLQFFYFSPPHTVPVHSQIWTVWLYLFSASSGNPELLCRLPDPDQPLDFPVFPIDCATVLFSPARCLTPLQSDSTLLFYFLISVLFPTASDYHPLISCFLFPDPQSAKDTFPEAHTFLLRSSGPLLFL